MNSLRYEPCPVCHQTNPRKASAPISKNPEKNASDGSSFRISDASTDGNYTFDASTTFDINQLEAPKTKKFIDKQVSPNNNNNAYLINMRTFEVSTVKSESTNEFATEKVSQSDVASNDDGDHVLNMSTLKMHKVKSEPTNEFTTKQTSQEEPFYGTYGSKMRRADEFNQLERSDYVAYYYPDNYDVMPLSKDQIERTCKVNEGALARVLKEEGKDSKQFQIDLNDAKTYGIVTQLADGSFTIQPKDPEDVPLRVDVPTKPNGKALDPWLSSEKERARLNEEETAWINSVAKTRGQEELHRSLRKLAFDGFLITQLGNGEYKVELKKLT